MSNDFYNYGSTLQPNTLARSEVVASELSAITSAFALLPRLAQICENRTTFGVDSGTANTYLITVPNPPAAYTAGLRVPFVPLNNSTGASTVNIYNSNGVLIGPKAILRGDGTATGAGDISTAGVTDLQYNGTAFILMGAPAGLVSAAAGSATAAAASAVAAASSASSAAASSSSASGSAGTATGAASTATTAATSATASAGTATTGATNASTSATAASTSQGAAATSATAAAGSATAASGSATAAATSATGAATSATTATGAATSATSSSTSASTAATNAANSAATALAAANSAGWTKVGFMTHAGSPYTVQQSDGGTLFSVDTSGGAVTINLPQISGLVTPYVVGFKKETGDGNTITINRGGSTDIFDTGGTSVSIASVQGITVLPHPTSPVEWLTSNWGGAAYTASLGVKLNGADIELDIAGLAAKTAPIGADSIALYDSVGGAPKKATLTQTLAAFSVVTGTVGAAASNIVALDASANLTLGKKIVEVQGTDVASASTVNLDTAIGNYVHVTGTAAITAITLAQGSRMTVDFTGILTLTNGASLILPTGANITTAAGDTAVFIGEASSIVRCVSYQRASGQALVAPATVLNNTIMLQEQQTAGTPGSGTFSANTWKKVPLTTKVQDTGSDVTSFSSSQFVLNAGTYRVDAHICLGEIPGTDGGATGKCRLRNVTDSTTVLVGTSVEICTDVTDVEPSGAWSQLRGVFTIAASKTLEFDGYISATTGAASALSSGNGEIEVYSQVVFTRVA